MALACLRRHLRSDRGRRPDRGDHRAAGTPGAPVDPSLLVDGWRFRRSAPSSCGTAAQRRRPCLAMGPLVAGAAVEHACRLCCALTMASVIGTVAARLSTWTLVPAIGAPSRCSPTAARHGPGPAPRRAAAVAVGAVAAAQAVAQTSSMASIRSLHRQPAWRRETAGHRRIATSCRNRSHRAVLPGVAGRADLPVPASGRRNCASSRGIRVALLILPADVVVSGAPPSSGFADASNAVIAAQVCLPRGTVGRHRCGRPALPAL